MARLLAAAVLLTLVACAAEDAVPDNAIDNGPPMAAAEAPPPAKEAAASAPVADAATLPELAFDAEGLRLVDPASGRARPIPFGQSRTEMLALLEQLRGPADAGTTEECGAGALDYAVWADGLTLHFQQDKFVGWALDPRAEGAHGTMSGIGPGSTRREVEAVYDATFEQSSLGTEFSAGGLHGVMTGPDANGRVQNLWAGTSCVFR